MNGRDRTRRSLEGGSLNDGAKVEEAIASYVRGVG